MIPKYLRKCLHAKFQRANECFNSLVCKQVPNSLLISLPALTFSFHSGFYEAACNSRHPQDIMRQAGIEPVPYIVKCCFTKDHQYILKACQITICVKKKKRMPGKKDEPPHRKKRQQRNFKGAQL